MNNSDQSPIDLSKCPPATWSGLYNVPGGLLVTSVKRAPKMSEDSRVQKAVDTCLSKLITPRLAGRDRPPFLNPVFYVRGFLGDRSIAVDWMCDVISFDLDVVQSLQQEVLSRHRDWRVLLVGADPATSVAIYPEVAILPDGACVTSNEQLRQLHKELACRRWSEPGCRARNLYDLAERVSSLRLSDLPQEGSLVAAYGFRRTNTAKVTLWLLLHNDPDEKVKFTTEPEMAVGEWFPIRPEFRLGQFVEEESGAIAYIRGFVIPKRLPRRVEVVLPRRGLRQEFMLTEETLITDESLLNRMPTPERF